jgi:hypothetical protein
LKRKIADLQQKLDLLKNEYEEKVSLLANGASKVQKLLEENKEVPGFQKLLTRIKGINIGQHSLNTGLLVLRNYIQNGFSVEIETDKLYFLLTQGSQEQIGFSNNFYQGQSATGNITEFYRFTGRYKLQGASIGKGNKNKYFQQFSWMRFTEVDEYGSLLQSPRSYNVFTLGSHFEFKGKRIAYDISKSIFGTSGNPTSTASNKNFLESLAFNLKLENSDPFSASKSRFSFFYSGLGYVNPGINGGNVRPGVTAVYDVERKVGGRFRIKNQTGVYLLQYGNEQTFQTFRERLDLRYRVKKWNIGLLINAAMGEQSSLVPKESVKDRSIDFLGTSQVMFKMGSGNLFCNGGFGFGASQQENLSQNKGYSYFAGFRYDIGKISLEANSDKFYTRQVQVYIIDSSALLLSSSINAHFNMSYTPSNGNVLQLGFQYRELNDGFFQSFLTGQIDLINGKRLNGGLNISLPLGREPSPVLINNTISARFTYNLISHEK